MRHFDVGDEDVGLVRKYGFERFFAVAGLRDYGNVAFDFEQGSQRSEHHALIFGEDDADRLASFFCGVACAFFSEGIQF